MNNDNRKEEAIVDVFATKYNRPFIISGENAKLFMQHKIP